MEHVVALHGVPTSPALWARYAVEAPCLRGVGDANVRDDWSVDSFVAELLPRVRPDTVLVGHDFGGVLAAVIATRVPVARLVLSGTALGPYWAMVRATARWPLRSYFYDRFGGRRFLTGAVSPGRAAEVLAAFDPARIPDLPGRMAALARGLRPPVRLAAQLRLVPTRLVWGRGDRWYPPLLARRLAAASGAELRWVGGGHLTPWEFPEAFAEAAGLTLRP